MEKTVMSKGVKVGLVALPVLYVSPPFKMSRIWLPSGPGTIAAYLRGQGREVILEDLSKKIDARNSRCVLRPWERLDIGQLYREELLIKHLSGAACSNSFDQLAENCLRELSCASSQLIGFSVMAYRQFLLAVLLSRRLKAVCNARIVFGGAFITIYGKSIFREFPFLKEQDVDYFIEGDAQVPMLELCRHIEGSRRIEEVPSLFYKKNGKVLSNGRKYFPIDELCAPDFSGLPLDSYRIPFNYGKPEGELVIPYQVTRGCPYNCSFCGGRRALNPGFAAKSSAKAVRELMQMKERYNSGVFHFCDECINASYEQLDEFCEALISSGANISWAVNARPDNLDIKLLKKLKLAGCRMLYFGIESGSDRILRMMGKGFTSGQASQVLKDVHAAGIESGVCFIYGHPHETKQDVLATVDFIKKNAPYISAVPSVMSLKVHHASPLACEPARFAIENLKPVYSDVAGRSYLYYSYDEVNGLKWSQKQKENESAHRIIRRAEFDNIVRKRSRIFTLVPFSFYYWLKTGFRFQAESNYRLLRLAYFLCTKAGKSKKSIPPARYWDKISDEMSKRSAYHIADMLGEYKRWEFSRLIHKWLPGDRERGLKTDSFEEAFGNDGLLERMRSKASLSVGMDISHKTVHKARANNPAGGLSWTASDAGRLPFKHQSFDYIVSSNTYGYLKDPLPGLQEAYRVLKPGGVLIVSVNNSGNICHRTLCRLSCIIGKIPFPVSKAYSPGGFTTVLSHAGFTVEGCERIVHIPVFFNLLFGIIGRVVRRSIGVKIINGFKALSLQQAPITAFTSWFIVFKARKAG